MCKKDRLQKGPRAKKDCVQKGPSAKRLLQNNYTENRIMNVHERSSLTSKHKITLAGLTCR